MLVIFTRVVSKCFLIVFLIIALSVKAQSQKAKIDALLQAYVVNNQFNGSALVIKNGKIVYDKSFGYGNIATKSLITGNSVFPIASLTKPFTALIILKLAEAKELTLEDPVTKYIPDFSRGDEIQIEHLLTHTAGLYDPTSNPKYLSQLLNHNRVFLPEEKLAYFKNEPLYFKPGSEFRYTNSNYDLLGMIIEKVTGLSYSAAVKKYIFNPLQMNKSGFNSNLLKDQNKVSGYSYLSANKQREIDFWNGSLTYASGGLYSTISDLQKFYEGLRDYKIVAPETFQKAMKPNLGGYGYGWFIDTIHNDRVIDHGGNIPGATSYFLMMPERQICVILLNNITSLKLEHIGNSIYSIMQNKPYDFPKPKQELHLRNFNLKPYIGTYDVNAGYKVEISNEGERLVMQINKEEKVILAAESKSKFFTLDDDLVIEFIFKDNAVIQIKIKQGLGTKIGDKIN